MNCNIKAYPLFERELKRLAKRYKSLRKDYAALLDELTENPMAGVCLSKRLRKVRMKIAAKGKGKSGGARVITIVTNVDVESMEVGLLYVYDKSERESISDNELLEVAKRNGLSL